MECKKQEVEVALIDKSKRNDFIDEDIDLDGIFNKAQTLEIGTDVDLDELETAHSKNLVKSNKNASNKINASNLIYKSAININKLAYESLKMNYLAKSFSLSQDPPAGFGNVGHHRQFVFFDKNNNLKQQQEIKKHRSNHYHNDFNTSSLPLKVWRGYHGNLYFEPFQLSNLKQSNNLVNKFKNNSSNFNKNNIINSGRRIKICQKTKSAPVTKPKQVIENNNIKTKSSNRSEHLINQSDLIFIHHLTSSTSKIILAKRPSIKHNYSNKLYSKSAADLISNDKLSDQNVSQNHIIQDNSIHLDDDKKSYHIVLPSNEIEKSEHTSAHHFIQTNTNNLSRTSASSNKAFLTEYNPELYFYANNSHSSKSFCFNCSIDKMNESNLQLANSSNTKKFQIRHFNTPISNMEKEILLATTDNHNLNRKANKTVSSAKPILPNLSAVKKQNIPIKGLAFRELTQRILLSNNETNNNQNEFEAYFELNIHSRNIYIDSPSNYEKKTTLIEASLLNANTNSSNNSTNNNSSGYRNYKQMLRNVKKGVTLNQREKTELNYNSYNKENKNLTMATPFTNTAGSQNNTYNNSKLNGKTSKTPSSSNHQQTIHIAKSASIANRNNRSVSQNVLKKLKIKGAKIDVINTNSLTDDRQFLYQHPHAPPSTSLGYERKSTHFIQNGSLNNSITSDNNYNPNNRIKSDKSYPSSGNQSSKRINPTPDIY